MFRPVDPHPNFARLEEEILKFWEREKIFEKSLEKTYPKSVIPAKLALDRDRGAGIQMGPRVKPEDEKHKLFIFYDGPPFATGLPHYGHILASTIKDVIPRYQTMKGRFVRRRWGWDCHGLPIEEIVERQLKISGKKEIEKIGIKKFNETCRSMVLRYVKEWGKMVRRIARWTEFENSYKTMDRDYMESVWWAFKQIYDKGLVYEGRKVLLYCPRCETPISKFEVAMDNSYREVTEEAVTVKFKVKTTPSSSPPIRPPQADGTGGEREGVYLLSWTTTPWTLPGNAALYVGKDIEYAVMEKDGENYIVAKDTVAEVFRPPEDGNLKVSATLKGKDLVGLQYEPLFDIPALRESINGQTTEEKPINGHATGKKRGSAPIPDRSRGQVYRQKAYKVYPADFVNTEEGTGIVHSAVVHGEEDYEYGLRAGLPIVPLLDEKGQFNKKAPKFLQGQYFKSAEKLIKADLEKRGLLFSRENYTHSYPHCWRCDTPLFYNAIPAWFINISKIKNQILKSNKKEINWYPGHLKFGRYAKSVEAAPDWNISRNRYWGNPMPVWRCGKCKENTVVGSIKELLERGKNVAEVFSAEGGSASGGRLPEDGDPVTSTGQALKVSATSDNVADHGDLKVSATLNNAIDLHRPYIDEVVISCERCGGEARRITEIFDSWFEAASMPFASVHWPFEPGHGNPVTSTGQALKVSPTSNADKSARYENVAEGFSPPSFPFPAQFVAEYIAQTRAWFYVMHVVSLVLFGKAPFENVVTTGTILNEKGEKLSKSRKNFPDPWEIINQYGVDALRFYLMNSAVMQGDDLNFSERDLATVYRKVVLILWNVYSYFVTYHNAKTTNHLPPLHLSPSQGGEGRVRGRSQDSHYVLDQWVLGRLQELINQVTNYLDHYDTFRATREIERFINELSTWYLRRSRGRSDEAFFATLRHVLLELSKVTAPFMPYLSEVIYGNLYKPINGHATGRRGSEPIYRQSVHLSDWPETKKLTKKQQELIGEMEKIREIVEEVHALRAKAGIKLRQKLGRLTVKRPINGQTTEEIPRPINGRATEESSSPIYRQLLDILKAEVNVQEVVFGDKLELDTKITPELRLEGLARELERQIQEFRKTSGLKIGEMADLYYQTDSEMIKKAMQRVERKKVYAATLRQAQELVGREVNIDGNKIVLKIFN